MNHCLHHYSRADFWNLSITDVATSLIAAINIVLIWYIFIYQRKKDRADHRFILDHIDFSLKSEWFKSVILEPNIKELHEFFLKLGSMFSGLQSEPSDTVKTKMIEDINDMFNNIEFRFLSILGCVDQKLEDNCIIIIDQLRDKFATEIYDRDRFNPEELRSFIIVSKRNLIKELYQFSPKPLS